MSSARRNYLFIFLGLLIWIAIYLLGLSNPFGFIDQSGRIAINLQSYDLFGANPLTWLPHDTADDVYSFSEGMAPIQLTKQTFFGSSETAYSFINIMGKMLPNRFSQVGHFSCGLAMARSSVNGKCGYIDKNGDYVISPKFDDAGEFSEGMAAVKVSGRWGYIDVKENMVISPQFKEVKQFSEGIAGVKNKRWGLVSKSGHLICEPKYGDIFLCSEGVVVATREPIQFDFIHENQTPLEQIYLNSAGKELHCCIVDAETIYSTRIRSINLWRDPSDMPQRISNTTFSSGLSVIKAGTKYGYVNKSFKIVIPAIYDYAFRFSEGRALVYKNVEGGLFGYIDTSGRATTPFKYKRASSFSQGLALASSKTNPEVCGYIDAYGRWAIAPKYRRAYPFCENRAQVGEGISTNCL